MVVEKAVLLAASTVVSKVVESVEWKVVSMAVLKVVLTVVAMVA